MLGRGGRSGRRTGAGTNIEAVLSAFCRRSTPGVRRLRKSREFGIEVWLLTGLGTAYRVNNTHPGAELPLERRCPEGFWASGVMLRP